MESRSSQFPTAVNGREARSGLVQTPSRRWEATGAPEVRRWSSVIQARTIRHVPPEAVGGFDRISRQFIGLRGVSSGHGPRSQRRGPSVVYPRRGWGSLFSYPIEPLAASDSLGIGRVLDLDPCEGIRTRLRLTYNSFQVLLTHQLEET